MNYTTISSLNDHWTKLHDNTLMFMLDKCNAKFGWPQEHPSTTSIPHALVSTIDAKPEHPHPFFLRDNCLCSIHLFSFIFRPIEMVPWPIVLQNGPLIFFKRGHWPIAKNSFPITDYSIIRQKKSKFYFAIFSLKINILVLDLYYETIFFIIIRNNSTLIQNFKYEVEEDILQYVTRPKRDNSTLILTFYCHKYI